MHRSILPSCPCGSTAAAGPFGLASYDKAGFDLLGAIYSGSHPLQRSDEVEPPPLALNATSAAATSADVGGDERVLELANEAEGGGELRIAWVDANGTSHDYGSVGAGATAAQRTFAGHVWELSNAHGVTRRYRVSEREASRVEWRG